MTDPFWSKVDVGLCWEWTASLLTGGYGQYRSRCAHRVAWELLVGPIPPGMELDHLCRNRRCVNPDHLEPVTHLVNVQRGARNGHERAKTHCPAGHPYAENEIRWASAPNARRCQICRRRTAREAQRRYQAKKKDRDIERTKGMEQ